MNNKINDEESNQVNNEMELTEDQKKKLEEIRKEFEKFKFENEYLNKEKEFILDLLDNLSFQNKIFFRFRNKNKKENEINHFLFGTVNEKGYLETSIFKLWGERSPGITLSYDIKKGKYYIYFNGDITNLKIKNLLIKNKFQLNKKYYYDNIDDLLIKTIQIKDLIQNNFKENYLISYDEFITSFQKRIKEMKKSQNKINEINNDYKNDFKLWLKKNSNNTSGKINSYINAIDLLSKNKNIKKNIFRITDILFLTNLYKDLLKNQ